MAGLAGKKIVMIIAHTNFRDEEFQIPYGIFTGSHAAVEIASSAMTPAKGKLGAVVTPTMLYTDIVVSAFDAIVFVGGGGAEQYFNDSVAHKIAQEAAAQGKVLGAICIAPVILAYAGVLKGKKATVFPDGVAMLKNGGAVYTAAGVQTDGALVTANGPSSAEGFAAAVEQALLAV